MYCIKDTLYAVCVTTNASIKPFFDKDCLMKNKVLFAVFSMLFFAAAIRSTGSRFVTLSVL